MLTIELRGAHFRNKGAQLMLIAMVEGLARIEPDARLVIAPSNRTPYLDRARLGLYQKVWYQKAGIQWGPLITMCLPSLFKDAYGLIDDQQLSAVLDASGFAYSDEWGGSHTIELAHASRRWARRRTQLIFMPQAFGPFEDRRNRRAMRSAAAMATAIFARDSTSVAHLQSILPPSDMGKIHLAPDFTTIVDSRISPEWPVAPGRACLVPNTRLIDRHGIPAAEYIELFRSAAELLDKAGLDPFFVVHEGADDADLVRRIVHKLESRVEVMAPSDSRVLKGILGQSELVFGSRFHALVGALSQGIPAVGVGWSHKYRELFADYDMPGFAFDMAVTPSQRILSKLDDLSDARSREDIRAHLGPFAEVQRRRVHEMWTTVGQALHAR